MHMLEVIEYLSPQGAAPTHVMYLTNVSWADSKKDLQDLTTWGLVDSTQQPNRKRTKIITRYFLTAKGREMLSHYRALKDQGIMPLNTLLERDEMPRHSEVLKDLPKWRKLLDEPKEEKQQQQSSGPALVSRIRVERGKDSGQVKSSKHP
jgi:predicted transcriptional regulator